MPSPLPDNVESHARRAVLGVRTRLEEEAHVRIDDVTLGAIEPVTDSSLARVADILVASRNEVPGISGDELAGTRGELVEALGRQVEADDVVVPLTWKVYPVSLKSATPGAVHDGVVQMPARKVVEVDAAMILDTTTGTARFETFSAGLRVASDRRRLYPAEVPDDRDAMAAVPMAEPIKTAGTALEVSEDLGQYIYSLYDCWGSYVTFRWKATLVRTSGPIYASPDEGVSDTFRYKVVFYPEIIDHAWHYWHWSAARFCVMGFPGSLPQTVQAFSTTEGKPFTSYLHLDFAPGRNDYISEVTTDLYSPPGPGCLQVSFSLSYVFGIGLGPTPVAERRWLTVNDIGATRTEVPVEHLTTYTSPGAMRGGCDYSGYVELSGRVRTEDQPDQRDPSEKGRLRLRTRIYACYMDCYALVYSWRALLWQYLDVPIEYVRGQAVRHPEIECTTADTALTIGEQTQVTVTVYNRSDVVSLSDAWLKLDLDSLENVLDIAGAQGSRVRIAEPDKPLKPGFPAYVSFTVEGEGEGDATPQFELEYRFSSPIPEDRNQGRTYATGQEIVVTKGEAKTGSLAGTISADRHPVQGATITLTPRHHQAWSGVDGSFTLGGLRPGDYRVDVTRLGYEAAHETVTIAPGAVTELNVTLAPLSTIAYIANRRTQEIHTPDCRWVDRMLPENQEAFATLRDALGHGYNGCYYCMRRYDTG